MSDVEKDALVFAEGLGVLIVFASIIAMKNKAKSPHITTGGIITGWVVGIFLIGTAEIVRRSQSGRYDRSYRRFRQLIIMTGSIRAALWRSQ